MTLIRLAGAKYLPSSWIALLLATAAFQACSGTNTAAISSGAGGGGAIDTSGHAGGADAGFTVGTGGTTGTGGVTAAGGAQTGAGGNQRGGSGGSGGQAAGGTSGQPSNPDGAVATGGRSGSGGSGSGGKVDSGAGGTSPDLGGPTPTGGQGGAGAGGTTSSAGGATSTGGGSGCPFTHQVMGWATQNGTTTGGGTTTPTVVSSLAALNEAAKGTTAAVIQFSGIISGSVVIGSNKTLIGACGGNATLKGHIQMSGSQNVILRNLTIVGNNCSDNPACKSGEDAITVINSANHLWFDHCDISDGSDGNLDITHAADFITISWTKFHYSGRRAGDHQFCNLIGHTDDNAAEDAGHLNVTFDHVWWADNVAQRMPRVRFGKVHVLNSLNTASGNDNGVGVGVDCNIRVENNVFVGVNSVFYANNGNAASIAESIGNSFTNCTGTTGQGTSFKPPYPYKLEDISTVEASVRAGAGTR